MNHIKNKIFKNFTKIPNELIEDKNLSDRSRFLYIYLASKPNTWEFYNKQLCNALIYSEDTLRKYLKELEKNGWVTKHRNRRIKGKFSTNTYDIHEKSKLRKDNTCKASKTKTNPKKTNPKKTDYQNKPLSKNQTLSKKHLKQKEPLSKTFLKKGEKKYFKGVNPRKEKNN